jgi:hypothetical protein
LAGGTDRDALDDTLTPDTELAEDDADDDEEDAEEEELEDAAEEDEEEDSDDEDEGSDGDVALPDSCRGTGLPILSSLTLPPAAGPGPSLILPTRLG